MNWADVLGSLIVAFLTTVVIVVVFRLVVGSKLLRHRRKSYTFRKVW